MTLTITQFIAFVILISKLKKTFILKDKIKSLN